MRRMHVEGIAFFFARFGVFEGPEAGLEGFRVVGFKDLERPGFLKSFQRGFSKGLRL